MTSALTAAVPGLALALSLMVAIGAQNVFVLRQGLLGERVGVVVLTCSLSDAALITASVAGTGAVVAAAPWLLVVVRLAGAAFLAWCALLAARRVCRPTSLVVQDPGRRTSLGALLVTCVALTWLNPHAYLDMLMLGTVAAAHEGHRWAFAVGAALASPLWFSLIGFGARLLRPVFGRPVAWRFLDAGTATVLGMLAVSLLLP